MFKKITGTLDADCVRNESLLQKNLVLCLEILENVLFNYHLIMTNATSSSTDDWEHIATERIPSQLDKGSLFEITNALMDLMTACTKFSLNPSKYDNSEGSPFRIVLRI